MTFFRFVAYLAPLAVGFGVPFALAVTRGKPPVKRALPAVGVLAAVLLLLGLGAFGESLAAFVAVSLLLAAFGALVAGFTLLAEACALGPEASQVAAGLLAAFLMSTVFWFGPVLQHAEEVGMPMDAISRRVMLALDVNPAMATGYSIFGSDWARSPGLYRVGLHEYPFAAPRWGSTAAGYALAGAFFFALAAGVRELRRRWAGPP